jgi:hypothetical protein
MPTTGIGGGSYYVEFITSNPSTGAAVNADSTPVATANKNGTDDATFTLTVTNIDTGRYKAVGTIPTSYNPGDMVNVTVAATVGGIAAKAVIDKFGIDLPVVRIGKAQTGSTSTTIILDSGASAINNFYNNSLVYLTNGTGAGQARTITGYVGGTQVATVDRAWATTPDNTSYFAILPGERPGVNSAGTTDVNVVSYSTGQDPGTYVLVTPANKLLTNISGQVTVASNLDKTGYSITTLPSIPANWITATGIASAALNGKGDWLLASSYTTPPTAAAITTAILTDTTAGNCAVPGSLGRIINVQLGGAFTTSASSIYTSAALANAPTGGGGGGGIVTGYATGQDPATYILNTPANKLKTDAAGRVDLGEVLGAPTLGGAGTVAVDWAQTTNRTSSVDLPNTTISPTQQVTLTLDFSALLDPPRDLTLIPDNQLTVNDAFHCAIAKAAGKELVVDLNYTIMTSAGTLIRAFVLDQNPNPGSRS